MPYVRRRGNHLAIVHGSRHPESGKVEQQVLMTLHSKAEALAALGRASEPPGRSFQDWMEARYPEVSFPWPKIEESIDELKEELPDIARSREDRALGGFRQSLAGFARHLIEADPQTLDSARELIETNRSVLTWLLEVIEWRLEASSRTEPNEWSRDPFGWRLALGGGTMDAELEEGVANLIQDGRADEAEAIFSFLVDLYPRYAEGWNYLGLIALERDDLEEALVRFETCERVGRKLFPKRIAKRDYWSQLETRPYMRGLMNQWTCLNRMGRYAKALRIAERLDNECADDITAATYRAVTYLNIGEWQLAHDAAVFTAGLYAEESLLASFAAFELGDLAEARARFAHAMLNKPRAVALVLGKPSPKPGSASEVMDHNAGAQLMSDIRGFLAKRSSGSKRYFNQLWKDERLAALREEVLAAERKMAEICGPGADDEEYRRLFDRLHALRDLSYAADASSPRTV